MSMIFQSYAIWPNMTVGENVGFGLQVRRLSRGEIDRKVDAILDVVQMRGLKARYPAELSGGQQQRVALARAIVVEPEVLLLDEPLSNLDANLREEMRFEIRRLHDEFKITTVYVTHDQSEAMVTSDRIVVMNKGRIEQIDAPHVLYARPKSRFVAGFIGRTNFLEGTPAGQRGRFDGFAAAAGRPRRRQRNRQPALFAAPAGHRPRHAKAERRRTWPSRQRSQGDPISANTGTIRSGRWARPSRCASRPAPTWSSRSAAASGWRSIPRPWYGSTSGRQRATRKPMLLAALSGVLPWRAATR